MYKEQVTLKELKLPVSFTFKFNVNVADFVHSWQLYIIHRQKKVTG